MSASKADIFNRALRRIGELARVQDPDTDTTRHAAACRDIYDDVLKEVLAAYDWQWATLERRIEEVSEQSEPYTGDGANDVFEVPFPFLDASQVTVEVDGVELDAEDYVVTPVSDDVATAYVTLDAVPANLDAVVVTVTVERNGWDYLYAAPADFVRAIGLVPDGMRWAQLPVEDRIEFELQPNDSKTGYLICTNAASDDFEVFRYVALMTHVPMMSGKFIDALLWRMGVDLALDIPKDTQKSMACQRQYEFAVSQASAQDQNGAGYTAEPETPAVRARG